MAEVKREHRERAILARFSSATSTEQHWIETGESLGLGSCGFDLVAQVIADAEERGCLRERADVRAELDHTMANANAQAGNSTGQLKTALGAVSAVLKSTIRLLDTGGHIGAAEKYRKD